MLDPVAGYDSLDLDVGSGRGGPGAGAQEVTNSGPRQLEERFLRRRRRSPDSAVEPLGLGAALLQSLIMFFNTGLDVWVNYGLFDR